MTLTLIANRGRTGTCCAWATLLLSCAISAHAAPQAGESDSPAGTNQNAIDLQPGRVVLLREGSTLVQTTGVMRRNADDRWTLLVDAENARAGTLELILLPCATLEEMERVAATSEGDPMFQTTGEVLVYLNKNYFLPTHSPHLLAVMDQSDEAPAEEPAEDVPAGDDITREDATEVATDDAPIVEGDSVEDIMRGLEERAGPIARSSAPTNARNESTASVTNAPLREGAMIVDRRGHLTRGGGGAWVFVFDADAEGLADPPAVVLPCQLLERMQQEARNAGNIAPMLITGRLFEYHGRTYVLPTLYRIPRDRTQLVP